ncbi:helix-turn-helix transcriptional regulator [Pseudoflavonifractor phocaeensis]|uniref:helix-turn-helix domain-containing protein n=1 Tax=Pseudoflavonifractor phocaeensis TaxID=1870988 RepID=UPI00313C5799
MTIGERIRKKRLELDMTLEDVARLIGVTRQTVQKYETGIVSNIPSDKVEALAKALKTSPSDLMGWNTSIFDQIKDTKQEILELKEMLKSTVDPIDRKDICNDIEVLEESLLDMNFIKNMEETPKPTPVSESGPISPEREALLKAVEDMDDETARVLLEMAKSIKKLREK